MLSLNIAEFRRQVLPPEEKDGGDDGARGAGKTTTQNPEDEGRADTEHGQAKTGDRHFQTFCAAAEPIRLASGTGLRSGRPL